MTVGSVIIAYLAIGVCCSLVFVYAVKRATDPGDDLSKHPDTQDAVRETERAVGGFPGGMIGALILIALAWPLTLAVFLMSRRDGR